MFILVITNSWVYEYFREFNFNQNSQRNNYIFTYIGNLSLRILCYTSFGVSRY
jgi:hypothetical protein